MEPIGFCYDMEIDNIGMFGSHVGVFFWMIFRIESI